MSVNVTVEITAARGHRREGSAAEEDRGLPAAEDRRRAGRGADDPEVPHRPELAACRSRLLNAKAPLLRERRFSALVWLREHTP